VRYDDIKPFRLTFWRPIKWERNLLDLEKKDMVSQNVLCEEVYIWDPAGDILNSIIDSDVRENLREMLIVGFSPDGPVNKRKVDDLRNVLKLIKKLIAEKKSEWSPCPREYSNDSIRANLLLSFLNHIEWICSIFENVPDISITIT
jgi:hypothetical protein